jgi:plasmid maintenance system antidote protein VapI
MAPEDNPAMNEKEWAELQRVAQQQVQCGHRRSAEFKPDWASPPGNTIKDILVEEEMSKEEFAEEMNLSIDQATDLLAGRARITLATARRLNLVFSGGVEFWMRRDLQYRESLATAKGAKWTPFGRKTLADRLFDELFDHPHILYVVPIAAKTRITEHLGAIELRADGRWNWWRWTSDFHKEWSGYAQGVAVAKQDAITRVEEGWL